MLNNAIKIIVLIGVVWGVYALISNSSDEWRPFYYPNAPDLTEHIEGPTVDTLEQCRDWIDGESISRSQEYGEFDYECGLNCSIRSNYGGLLVCEETVQ